jgi:hypothetical protein
MVGRQNGLIARLKTINSSVKWTHCIIHREALASKQLNEDLNSMLKIAVKTVNLIKLRPLNLHLFRSLFHDMGSEHITVLLHSNIRWLSRGKLFNCLFELRSKLQFFSQKSNLS